MMLRTALASAQQPWWAAVLPVLPPTTWAGGALHWGLKTSAYELGDNTASEPLPGSEYYRVPFGGEEVEQRRPGDRRAQARLEQAIETALLSDAILRDRLVQQHGFTVHRIRLSKDRRRAAVLWDAHPGQAPACARQLQLNAARLRQLIARNVQSKHTPFLDFKHDHLPAQQADTATALMRAEAEAAAADGAAAVASAGPATGAATAQAASKQANAAVQQYAGHGADADDAVAAAVQQLATRLRRKAWLERAPGADRRSGGADAQCT